jgi:hypothetical protein
VPRIDEKNAGAGSLHFDAVAILMRPVVWLLHCLLGRPRDSLLAILVASAISAIVINSLFLQHGRHPAPIFAQARQSVTADPRQEFPTRQAAQNTSLPRPSDTQPFILPQRPVAADDPTGAVVAALPRQRPAEAPAKAQQIAARAVPAHKDAIADMLAPMQQLTAIQRALSDYGYGQISPNGNLGPDTRAAIERFERERRLPVTGQVSDRLVRELAAMTGRKL